MRIFTTTSLLGLLFFCTCSSEETESTNHTSTDTSDSTSIVQEPLIEDKNEVTITAMVDGPDADFFIESFGEYSDEDISNASTINIVPYIYGADDSSEVYSEMKVIARDNFHLSYAGLGDYSGNINLFYDGLQQHLAVSYKVTEGSPTGNCTLYDTEGNVYIERVYDDSGSWMFSGKEPYATDWTYDQSSSSLIINDTNNGFRNDTLVELMLSFHDEDWAFFDKIVEKKSFENQFLINGTPFSGKLMAYQHPTYGGDLQEFELNFKNGYLHGDIKLYEWWGELTLHEIFDNGEMIEQVYALDPAMMDGMAKPIIYIYPEKKTDVTVHLSIDGHLTHTYPAYNHGWKVTASPDGTLMDQSGKEYYALYWEGKENETLTIPNGTVVAGDMTISFLEEKLPKLGLNARETNEFIIFWMPHLENNPYNLIHFASDAYTETAKLNISPEPETIIRVMMVFQPLTSPVKIEEQNLSELYTKREGYTVVEWGGRKITSPTL